MITPEEIVRQKFIQFLIYEMGVPLKMIAVEEPICRFREGAKGRADIVVYTNHNNESIPILVIECKAHGVPITAKTFEQVFSYDNYIQADLIGVTNGDDFYLKVYNNKNNEYFSYDKIPVSDDLLNLNHFEKEELTESIPLLEFKDCFDTEIIEDHIVCGLIGIDTPEVIRPFIMNLFCRCICDESIIFENTQLFDFKILKDGGLRIAAYGNAAGGFYDGIYRYL